MSKPIITTSWADLQILELDAWWRANREKAPNKFDEELAIAFQTLSVVPGAGQRYPHPEEDVRRVLLRSTRNHVYYIERKDYVLVVAVWGAIRGSGPDLSGVRW
jgi:plasmid stabilization system protein ParE